MKNLFLINLLMVSVMISAETINEQRAKSNYQIFCQGCHSPDGSGNRGVPQMRGELGDFLLFQEGREFLVRVPGSANASLNNQELAELLNWMITTFGEKSIPSNWQHYTREEVEKLRKNPLMEVFHYRKELIKKVAEIKSTD